MRTAGYFLGAVLAAALGACARPSAQAPVAQAGKATTAAVGCPLAQLPGIHATVTDIRDGVAITFTGPTGEVDQLRANVHAMKDASDKQKDAFAACPCAQRAVLGAAERMPEKAAGEKVSGTPHATFAAIAKVDETTTGAILKLTAKDKADVHALRTAVREDMRELHKSCVKPEKSEKAPTEKQGSHPYP
jgi:hypothetical protein